MSGTRPPRETVTGLDEDDPGAGHSTREPVNWADAVVLGSDDVSVDEQIKRDDAGFRRTLAIRMFWLFTACVTITPLLYVTSVLGEMTIDGFESHRMAEIAGTVSTAVIGAVAGVFGSVVGFYYGSESK